METAVAEFLSSSAETVGQPAKKRARKETEHILQIVSVASFDARELCRYMMGVDDCRELLTESEDQTLGVSWSAKKRVRLRNGSSMSEAVLYRKDNLASRRRQRTMGLSLEIFLSPKIIQNTLAIYI